jgi:serine/threonine protein kinase
MLMNWLYSIIWLFRIHKMNIKYFIVNKMSSDSEETNDPVRRQVIDSFIDRVITDQDKIYKVVKLLGVGGTGYVFLVVETNENKFYAMKYIPYNRGKHLSAGHDAKRFDYVRALVDNEINCLRKLKDVCREHFLCYVDSFEVSFDEHVGKIIITEFLEGYIEMRLSGVAFEYRIWYFTMLINIIKELQGKGISHGDIQSGNIFVSLDYRNMKLLDFGLCKPSPTEDQFANDWYQIGWLISDCDQSDEDINTPEMRGIMNSIPPEYINPEPWDQRYLSLIGLTGGWTTEN